MFCRLQYGLLLPRIGQSARVTGHWQESTTYLERLQAQGVDVSEGMEAYAQILFLASEPGFEAFLKLKMEGPGDKKLPPMQADRLLFEQLRTKTAALVELERNSTRIVQTGVGPWGLAALTRLGEAYENMADSILQSWIPTYLTPEQQELYRMALQDKAWPQTERATLAYSQALQQAYRLSIYDENTAQAVRRLGVLRPEQYPGLYETVPTVRAAASTIDVVSFRTE